MKGLFITFEGIEGCGKSTQIRLLNEHLMKRGYRTVLTREPGGTAIGERIRDILLDVEHGNMSPKTELLLYAAARSQHIFERISKALGDGSIVLSDRYADATAAYQGAARRIDPEAVEAVHRIATDGLLPDITFLLDCPAETGLSRIKLRGKKCASSRNLDRMEREDIEFHERVRSGYLDIAKREPGRVKVIDSKMDIGAIHERIVAETEKFISDNG